MHCVTCGAPGHDTRGAILCVHHGGVPSAAFVAALVGGQPPSPLPNQPPNPWLTPTKAPDEVLDRLDELDAIDELEEKPPAALRVYTWLFVVVTTLHAVLLVVDVLVLRREDAVLRAYEVEPSTLDRPATQAVFALVDRVGEAVTVALWVTLLMFAVWFGVVGRVTDRLGHDRRTVLRHWTYLGWRLALIPLVVYLFAEAARDEGRPADRSAFVAEALSVNHTAIMFASLRIVMLGLLCAFVVVVWRRLNPREPVLPPPY
ncbi:hypothetical protein GCM10022255_099420 [Dactylosporangium darangshiense]|uniref:DUF4328 domain-containing protein n=1 Tax=Dactylosporangium darangshiense TaxID=579108 RepID=A0ABP8DRH6_9ACTN